ncbi:hypothetical protein NDU88_003144 [Pleurodeles waltl]|uniref:Uncharacterized protein n=1 Tax=Pleurodeles waltl TaxID=8319 RepID=A0AAV7VGM1_PLEWA|nr:hypothetical protein NDU88_003144 [Pleurodeles waltl]
MQVAPEPEGNAALETYTTNRPRPQELDDGMTQTRNLGRAGEPSQPARIADEPWPRAATCRRTRGGDPSTKR